MFVASIRQVIDLYIDLNNTYAKAYKGRGLLSIIKMKDNLAVTLGKIKATMCSCGSITIEQLQKTAKITLVSSTSIVEGGAHDVILKEQN